VGLSSWINAIAFGVIPKAIAVIPYWVQWMYGVGDFQSSFLIVKEVKGMPEFVNPFSGKVPERKLTKQELIRAIRLNIAAEHEAVHLYMAHAEAIDDPLAKEVLVDIANEEREHIGEFTKLLEILTGD
jgi:hypothetical protein